MLFCPQLAHFSTAGLSVVKNFCLRWKKGPHIRLPTEQSSTWHSGPICLPTRRCHREISISFLCSRHLRHAIQGNPPAHCAVAEFHPLLLIIASVIGPIRLGERALLPPRWEGTSAVRRIGRNSAPGLIRSQGQSSPEDLCGHRPIKVHR